MAALTAGPRPHSFQRFRGSCAARGGRVSASQLFGPLRLDRASTGGRERASWSSLKAIPMVLPASPTKS